MSTAVMRKSVLLPLVAPLAAVAALATSTGAKPDAATSTITVKPNPYCKAGLTETISVEVVPDGAWIGDDVIGARCFVARKRGALDTDALRAELARIRTTGCMPGIELAGAAGTTYQDLVAAMDAAVLAKLTDPSIAPAAELSVSFDDTAAARKGAPARCEATRTKPAAPATKAPPAATTATKPAAAASAPDVKTAPVLVISASDVSLGARL